MKSSEFFKKVFSWKLWANLFAMALVVVAACFGVKYGIDLYTHHGERIQVPNVRHKSFADAEHILDKLGLKIEVSDTGYVKVLPPDCILEQSILPGTSVKSGRIVYVVINAANTPTLTIPDVIDNSSYREARAKLEAMGFKVGMPNRIPGEKDWVYGIRVRGMNVTAGQKVSIEDVLVLQVGDGMIDSDDSIMSATPIYGDIYGDSTLMDHELHQDVSGEHDDFEVVTGP
jgi:beta-lactam-binding protein with PASTA domain